jgi:hypothetical protein
MSTDKKLFTIAGTSILNGELSVRVATGQINVRHGVLRRNGHEDIKLFELPKPMTRADAAAYIETLNGEFPLPAPKPAKVKAEKPAKAPKEPKAAKVKPAKTEMTAEEKAAAARERKNAQRRAARAAAKEAIAA